MFKAIALQAQFGQWVAAKATKLTGGGETASKVQIFIQVTESLYLLYQAS